MIFYKCYGNHDKNKTTDVDKLKENERKLLGKYEK